MAVEIRIRRQSLMKAGLRAMSCFLKMDIEKKQNREKRWPARVASEFSCLNLHTIHSQLAETCLYPALDVKSCSPSNNGGASNDRNDAQRSLFRLDAQFPGDIAVFQLVDGLTESHRRGSFLVIAANLVLLLVDAFENQHVTLDVHVGFGDFPNAGGQLRTDDVERAS